MTEPKVISKSSSLLFIIVPTSHKGKNCVCESGTPPADKLHNKTSPNVVETHTSRNWRQFVGFSTVAFFSHGSNTTAQCVNHFIRPEIIHPMRLLEGNYRSHRVSLAITFHGIFMFARPITFSHPPKMFSLPKISEIFL